MIREVRLRTAACHSFILSWVYGNWLLVISPVGITGRCVSDCQLALDYEIPLLLCWWQYT